MRYINKVKSRHVVGLPTFVVIIIVVKKGFNVRAMFDQSCFSLSVNHNTLHHFFACTFYHFTCLPILEGSITGITKYGYDKYFSIAAWGKSGGSYDAK